ncbi:hypothetical protein Tco_0474339 [Tanacetum coccineum]
MKLLGLQETLLHLQSWPYNPNRLISINLGPLDYVHITSFNRISLDCQYNMADKNVPAPAPIRSDDQIFPFAAWVPIGKSNYILDLQKKQKNPIFQILVDILQNINFFRAITALASVPSIYIH